MAYHGFAMREVSEGPHHFPINLKTFMQLLMQLLACMISKACFTNVLFLTLWHG